MKIDPQTILVKDLVVGYEDKNDEGVFGYDGKLDIRPPYQRNFVYEDKDRKAVIKSILNDFPLNILYWSDNGNDAYEVLDGQQRIISICQFIKGEFSVDDGSGRYFSNLTKEEREKINNYELMVYFCSGTDKEKLDWFEVINIAGVVLTKQELRNAIYTGTWLHEAKKLFSKPNCPAEGIGKDYLKGKRNRQEYLETAIKWISDDNIVDYMATHQHEPNANELWLFFQNVINWVAVTFPQKKKEMKGVPFGKLYKKFKGKNLDPAELQKEIDELWIDDTVTNRSGIYEYVLTRDESKLSIRAFSDQQKSKAYKEQKGLCKKCAKPFDIDEMEADHIKPFSKGGRTTQENCQMLCRPCNRAKSNI